MLNDLTSPLSALETRRSGKPRDMTDPGPTAEELKHILTIAARTPDHGTLTPWRFLIIAHDQRDALAEVLRKALIAQNPDPLPAQLQKEQDFAHYPGQLVVLLSSLTADHKIPIREQELAVGAAGMNLLHGAHALGYVAGWVTGWRTYSDAVEAALCEPGERIAGFIFIGHPARELEDRPRPQLSEVVRNWSPPSR